MKKSLSLLFLFCVGQVSAQKADSFSRLIAHAYIATLQGGSCPDYYYYLTGDSTIYTYSGTRGGDLNHDMKFDISRTYSYDTTLRHFITVVHDSTTQTFDTANNLLSRNQNGYAKWAYTYDGANRMLSRNEQTKDYYSGAWHNSTNETWEYDSRGNMVHELYQQAGVNTSYNWFDASQQICGFDNLNRPTSIINQTGIYPSGGWLNSDKTDISYSANNSTTLLALWDTVLNAWRNSKRTTNCLNTAGIDSFRRLQLWDNAQNNYGDKGDAMAWFYAGGRFVKRIDTSHIYWAYYGWQRTLEDSIVYDNSGRMINHYTNYWDSSLSDFKNGLPQTIIANHDGNVTVSHLTYNSFGQITSIISGMDTNRFYYETVKVVTGDTIPVVHDTLISGDYLLKLYPVPAAQQLNVELTWDTARSFVLSLHDSKGRSVESREEPAVKNYQQPIDISALPAGNYFLTIFYDKGVIRRQFPVVHR